MTDYDPRIVDLYDGKNPDGPDHDYFRSLASQHGAGRILDVGCGTGILTVTFTGEGREVVGVDPSAAMLAYARQRPGAVEVAWVEGYAGDVREGQFDLIVMSGNVAQHIADPDWESTLKDVRRLAAPGSGLSFESRNPSVRVWESWSAEEPTSVATSIGPITEWREVEERGHGQVRLRNFTRFETSNETIEESLLLTFRSADLLTGQLAEES